MSMCPNLSTIAEINLTTCSSRVISALINWALIAFCPLFVSIFSSLRYVAIVVAPEEPLYESLDEPLGQSFAQCPRSSGYQHNFI